MSELLRKDFIDLGYTAFADVKEHSVGYYIFASVESYSENNTKTIELLNSSNETMPYFDLGECLAKGAVKWDGCSDWDMSPQDIMLHFCSRHAILDLAQVMVNCFDWTAELLTNFIGD
ncbi:MAG: hypothetical protein KME47_09755 [Nodosilinea sp. WJT8-NPBG4]|jgi:hypothetical protein|nr:hypothetical protein [Nodosilinea sp. WJT8-NPBG4]